MPKSFFRIGDVLLNVHLITKIEDWTEGIVPIYWGHGEEGGSGVAISYYPNGCESFSEKYLQEQGWADREALIETLGNAVDFANG